jgi:hypothetical protein
MYGDGVHKPGVKPKPVSREKNGIYGYNIEKRCEGYQKLSKIFV